ncbi:MAG: SDR family oxidoreductase [Deltaproteobacteria bacterium]|nr:SDR family oxidoreductase [Deltaproteobacteria bacterium]
MYTDLAGKTALITGAGKRTGIGYAIARKLAGFKTHIVIADLGMNDDSKSDVKTGKRDEMLDIADELKKEFGIETLAVNLDVSRTDSIEDMAKTVKDKFDNIHILCNNAGASFGVPNAVHNYEEEAWLKTIDVNLHGVFRVSKAIVPMMTGTGGSIINTASRAGKVPPLFNGAYAAAKAGVIMMLKRSFLEQPQKNRKKQCVKRFLWDVLGPLKKWPTL